MVDDTVPISEPDHSFLAEQIARTRELLRDFALTAYRFTFTAGEMGLELPPFKGGTLRGGFGFIFKSICCTRLNKPCKGCELEQDCPYAYIFETSPPSGAQRLRNYEDIPRPFVIEPPGDERTSYRPGDKLPFTLLLFGCATNYLPYFILSFRELARRGLGGRDRTCRLTEIEALDLSSGEAKSIYDHKQELIRSVEFPYLLRDAMQTGGIETVPVTVTFKTFTRIKHEGDVSRAPHFHVLLRGILRRLSALVYFHGGVELELDYKGLFREGEKVSILRDETRWANWSRFSRRQGSRVAMDGLLGSVVYAPQAAGFLPFLRLGEIMHVGKNTPFGLGKYTVAT